MKESLMIKDKIIEMFTSGKREITGDFQGKIISILGSYLESILIDGIEIKGIYFIKGEIFPSPKKGDIIRFHEMKFSQNKKDNYNFKVVISKFSEPKNIIISDKKDSLDFSKNNITNELKKLMKIDCELKTGLFMVKRIQLKNDNLNLECLSENQKERDYKINKKNLGNINENDIILILNYFETEKDEIKINNISKIEILNDINLFKYLDKNEFNKTCFFGKIIEINYFSRNNATILFIDKGNNLKTLNINQDIKNFKFELFELCFIINCRIENNNIIITKDSKIYLSSQDIYFEELDINNNSVIEFYFPDFLEGKNFYDIIEIKHQQKKIDSNILYFVFNTYYKDYNDFFPIDINLISSKNNVWKKFKFILVHGILNTINCFINYSGNESFFYEFYYYSFLQYSIPSSFSIEINDKKYYLNKTDSFDCTTRRRFNLLNVPKNNSYSALQLNNSNSFQICRVYFTLKESSDFGLFSLDEIKYSISANNLEFDKYYDKFGGILDYVIENRGKKEDIDKLIKYCKDILDSEPYVKNKKDYFLSMQYFEEDLSLSQFKSRIGIILCFYLLEYHPSLLDHFLSELKNLYEKTEKYKLNFWDKLNVLYFFIVENMTNRHFKIIFVDELKDNTPYKLAIENNLNEIKYLKETSCLFFAYLQLNSFVTKNYLVKNKKSYLFSMQSLFILKRHMKKQYKKYFILTYTNENFLAKYNEYFQVTLINENLLFPDYDFNKIKDKVDDKSKDLAVPISSSFRHENNGHSTKDTKNKDEDSPGLICKIEGPKIINDRSISDIGESGLFIDSFIGTEEEMNEIDFSRHLGETLNYKYYIKENFDELKQKIKDLEKFKEKCPSVKQLTFSKLEKNNIKKKEVKLKDKNLINKKQKENFKYNKRKYSSCYCGDPLRLEYYLRYLHENLDNNNEPKK